MIWWLFLIPASLAAPRIFPLVDPGLFVISGVKTCGGGGGYCLLGLDCTLDEDFLPDDEGGNHCEGLKSAFTPSAHFVCCRAANKTVYKPPIVFPSVITTVHSEPVTTRTTTLDVLENEIDQVLLKVANAVKKTPVTESSVVGLYSGVDPGAELRETEETGQDSSSLEEDMLADSIEGEVLQGMLDKDEESQEDGVREVVIPKESVGAEESLEDDDEDEDDDDGEKGAKENYSKVEASTLSGTVSSATQSPDYSTESTNHESTSPTKVSGALSIEMKPSSPNLSLPGATYEPKYEATTEENLTEESLTQSNSNEYESEGSETTSSSHESVSEEGFASKMENSLDIQLQDSSEEEEEESVEESLEEIASKESSDESEVDSSTRPEETYTSTFGNTLEEKATSNEKSHVTSVPNHEAEVKIKDYSEIDNPIKSVPAKPELMSDQATSQGELKEGAEFIDEEINKPSNPPTSSDEEEREKLTKSNPATNEVLSTDHDHNKENSFHNLLKKDDIDENTNESIKPNSAKETPTHQTSPVDNSSTLSKNTSQIEPGSIAKEEGLVTSFSVSPVPNNGQLTSPAGDVQGHPEVTGPCSRSSSSNCSGEVRFTFENETLCFGSIYKTDWVVTSASCALRVFRMGMLMVKISMVKESSPDQDSEVKTIIVHESYGEGGGTTGQDLEPNNIGLVQVKSPMSQWRDCVPCLPQPGKDRDFTNLNCSALTDQPLAPSVDKGCSTPGGCHSERSLVEGVSMNRCEGRPRDMRDDLDFPYLTLACDTLWQPRFADQSPRGSGSPLLCRGTLVGLETSRGVGLMVYTPLTRYMQWLDKNTQLGSPDQLFNLRSTSP